MWVGIGERWSSDELAQQLHTHLWVPVLAAKSPTSRRAELVDASGVEAMAIVAEAWQSQLQDQAQALEEARSLESAAMDEVHRLRRDLESRAARIAGLHHQQKELEAQLEGLRADLEHERQAKRDAVTQSSYDYETLRARLSRRIQSETQLLHEGLHALRQEPPLAHVMEDRAERALEGLEAELKALAKER